MYLPWQVTNAIGQWHAREHLTYGVNDCCQFAGFVVKYLTQIDYLDGIQYASQDDAEQLVASRGGLKAMVSDQVGRLPVSVEQLNPGAIVYWSYPGNYGLGIAITHQAGRMAVIDTKGLVVEMGSNIARCGWNI